MQWSWCNNSGTQFCIIYLKRGRNRGYLMLVFFSMLVYQHYKFPELMTTIIDYVVLNATFSSTTINLVNLDSSVFFLCLILPWRAATEQSRFLTSLFIQLIWSHGIRPSLHWKTRKDADIRPFPKHDPSFENVKGRM